MDLNHAGKLNEHVLRRRRLRDRHAVTPDHDSQRVSLHDRTICFHLCTASCDMIDNLQRRTPMPCLVVGVRCGRAHAVGGPAFTTPGWTSSCTHLARGSSDPQPGVHEHGLEQLGRVHHEAKCPGMDRDANCTFNEDFPPLLTPSKQNRQCSAVSSPPCPRPRPRPHPFVPGSQPHSSPHPSPMV